MKRTLLLVLCMTFFTGTAFAQQGAIGIFGDQKGSICEIYDKEPGSIKVYVIHMHTLGSTGSEFKVDHESWGTELTFIGQTSPYIAVIGKATTGVAIAYGECIPGPNHILTITYFGNGNSPACSYIDIVPDPNANPPGIYVTNCAVKREVLSATGSSLVVNPDETCRCVNPEKDPIWKGVKELYK